MEQRDLIKDQIEQLGKVLGKLLADFLKMKSTGNVSQGIEIVDQQLDSTLDLSLEAVLTRPKRELKEHFLNRNTTAEQLETLSDLLKAVGESKLEHHPGEARNLLLKAGELLDIADEITATASFIRMDKKGIIDALLSEA